jgi:hypothetical protein
MRTREESLNYFNIIKAAHMVLNDSKCSNDFDQRLTLEQLDAVEQLERVPNKKRVLHRQRELHRARDD